MSVDLWLIDLDDTLFEASGGVLHEIHLRMNDFIVKVLRIPCEEAHALRARYWAEYGSTFIGMWRNHGIDPRVFLRDTHNFDFAPYVTFKGDPRAALDALPGRKVLFSNGPSNYVEAVLDALGAASCFTKVISGTDMRIFGDWRPKPSRSMLRCICASMGVAPRHAALVDDSLLNLRAAAEVGMHAVWCTGYRRARGKLTNLPRPCYVEHMISHIRELRRLFSKKSAADAKAPALKNRRKAAEDDSLYGASCGC